MWFLKLIRYIISKIYKARILKLVFVNKRAMNYKNFKNVIATLIVSKSSSGVIN